MASQPIEYEDTTANPLLADCRYRSRKIGNVDVYDLSAGGCVLDQRAWTVDEGERVLIKLPGLDFMTTEVVWLWEHRAGLRFEQPLYGAVLEHLGQYRCATPPPTEADESD